MALLVDVMMRSLCVAVPVAMPALLASTPPPAPDGRDYTTVAVWFRPEGTTSTRIKSSRRPIGDASAELFNRSAASMNAGTRVGQVGAGVTTFVQTVTANTWIYRVQAFNANGVSGYSNQATIRVR